MTSRCINKHSEKTGVTYELRRVENVLTTLVDRTRVRSAGLLGESFLRFKIGEFLEACGEDEVRVKVVPERLLIRRSMP